MIFRRVLMACVAIALFGAAAGVVVIAAAFAVYALARTEFGDAGAAAITALVFAVLLALGGLIVAPRQRKRVRAEPGSASAVADELMDLVRDKPLASAAVALAAGIMAMRNPRVIGEVVRGLFQRPEGGKRKR